MSAQNSNSGQSQPRHPRRWLFAHCEYLEKTRQLLVQGEQVKLEPKPLLLLEHILESPTQIHTKEALLDAVWPETWTTDQSLTTAVNKLRNAFGGERDQILRSVSGKGYRMATPVTCVVESDDDQRQTEPAFQLEPGDPIPNRPNWRAVRPLLAGIAPHAPMVWLAEHSKTHEQRVFKFAIDGVALRALQREVSLSRFLQQSLPDESRFVRVIDWDLDNSPFFVETEYSGANLLEWSQTDSFNNLSLEARIALLADLAEAIAAAHSIGILHNDLKPSNVLVLRRGNSKVLDSSEKDWTVKVADLGIASLTQPERIRALHITYLDPETDSSPDPNTGKTSSISERSSLSGSALYRAPEQYSGAAPSIQGDVYALGVMLYQIACGDLLASLSPGWESKISDPLLREDIKAAANVDPKDRLQAASGLAKRLRDLDSRRVEREERQRQQVENEIKLKRYEKSRARQPFIWAAVGCLVVGLCTSILFFIRAVRDRDLAERQNATSEALYHFLADDLLSQADPFQKGASPGQPSQKTLVQAIDQAIPQIDRRFQVQPEIAGQLHETVAEALSHQTNFAKADLEFDLAAKRLREAQGPLSQAAIVIELKRESSMVSSNMPGALGKANAGLARQKVLAAQVNRPTPELTAWLALTESAVVGSGPHPEQALPMLNQAIRQAETNTALSPRILLLLRQRLCYLYLKMGDGPKAESAARELIAADIKVEGPDSLTLLWGQNNLQEAFYIEGKHKEALEEINRNYPRFIEKLGASNLYSLQTLSTRAVVEGELKDYDDAIRDDLAAQEAAMANPSAAFFQVGGFIDAATSECRIHRYASGIDHARKAYQQAKSSPGTAQGVVGGSAFSLAECLLSRYEDPSTLHKAADLSETKALLDSINVPSLAHLSGMAGFEGDIDVAQSRLYLALKEYKVAAAFARKARPFYDGPGADPYEKESLARVETALAKVMSSLGTQDAGKS